MKTDVISHVFNLLGSADLRLFAFMFIVAVITNPEAMSKLWK